MSLRRLAALIPPEYRKEILATKMIDNAVAIHGDNTMQYLIVIWKNYVERDFEPDCPLCLSRVLKNFKEMKSTLVEMENESKQLDLP